MSACLLPSGSKWLVLRSEGPIGRLSGRSATITSTVLHSHTSSHMGNKHGPSGSGKKEERGFHYRESFFEYVALAAAVLGGAMLQVSPGSRHRMFLAHHL